ncbi:MAG: hypothetical protein ACK4TM_04395 [Yoonia sp.]
MTTPQQATVVVRPTAASGLNQHQLCCVGIDQRLGKRRIIARKQATLLKTRLFNGGTMLMRIASRVTSWLCCTAAICADLNTIRKNRCRPLRKPLE